MSVLRHVSHVVDDLTQLTVSKVWLVAVWLLEGVEVPLGVRAEPSIAAVVLLHAPSNLSAIQGGLPTLRIAESKGQEILRSSCLPSPYLDFFVVEHW